MGHVKAPDLFDIDTGRTEGAECTRVRRILKKSVCEEVQSWYRKNNLHREKVKITDL